jgi:hypothetical protein
MAALPDPSGVVTNPVGGETFGGATDAFLLKVLP